MTANCCILTFDRVVNKRRTFENKWKQSQKLRAFWNNICKCLLISWVSCSQWMPESDPTCSHRAPLLGAVAYDGLQSLRLRPLCKEAEDMLWGLEDNTVCYGEEKKKLWVHIAICCCLTSSDSYAQQRFVSIRKNKKAYIFLQRNVVFNRYKHNNRWIVLSRYWHVNLLVTRVLSLTKHVCRRQICEFTWEWK